MIHVINWFVNILTLGLVSIATITTTTYHVDEPIPELNNLSLTQVFETNNLITNGDFSDGTTGWNTSGATNISINNGFITFLPTQQFGGIRQNNVFELGKIYYNHKLTTTDSDFVTYAIGVNGSNIQLNNSNGNEVNTTISGVYQVNSITLARLEFSSIRTSNFVPVSISDVHFLNLTTLNIADLTKEQMDYWFSIYQQAVANNGVYIESNAHLNNNIHLVDVSVMVISFGLWTWLYKFLKGVVL